MLRFMYTFDFITIFLRPKTWGRFMDATNRAEPTALCLFKHCHNQWCCRTTGRSFLPHPKNFPLHRKTPALKNPKKKLKGQACWYRKARLRNPQLRKQIPNPRNQARTIGTCWKASKCSCIGEIDGDEWRWEGRRGRVGRGWWGENREAQGRIGSEDYSEVWDAGGQQGAG